jgi:chromosomal replication initiation ATPase DnaA
MYIARRVVRRTYPQIAQYMGSRHHTTVMHAEREIHARLHDPAVMADLTAICAKLGER